MFLTPEKFPASENYALQVSRLIDESETVSVAVAFWGRKSEQIFSPSNGRTVRIICNLTMGGTNPEPITNLLTNDDVAIRHMDQLHAKVIVGDHAAIVGSANFSTNGINFEGEETDGWEEAGFLITDQDCVDRIQEWFDKIWDQKSQKIMDEDLALAKRRWEDQRKSRVQIGVRMPLMQYPLSALKDRPIYLAIWRVPVSPNSEPAFDALRQRLALADNFNYFDQWDTLPAESSIIDVYFGRRGRIVVGYSWRRVPEMDQSYRDTDGNEQMIQVAVKIGDVCGMSFRQEDKDAIRD